MGKKSKDEEKKGSAPQGANRPRGIPGLASGNPRATLKAAAASLSLRQPLPVPNETQKALLKSSFHSGDMVERLRTELPGVWDSEPKATSSDPAEASQCTFDGAQPAEGVTSRDVWKIVKPPVESRENERSAALYSQVINQFAAGNNPRYVPDGSETARAHIFVWDVSRAMGAEIPHMLGARSLTLQQMADWLRYEGSDRGWVNVGPVERALQFAFEGRLVVVVPKDQRAKPQWMAVLRPLPLGADRQPRVAAAARVQGNDVSAVEALGVNRFDFFSHP